MSDEWDGIDRTYGERWGGDRPSTGDLDYGPVLTGRHRRFSVLRILRTLLMIALVLVVAVVGLGLVVGLYASSQIQRQEVAGLVGGTGSLNILVVGFRLIQ